MPKDNIDYSNTIIYKIYCKNNSIKDIYIGHTTNFTKRKYQHKICCNSGKKLKIYDIIRKNGGWEEWDMIEIARYNCQDAVEARIREQEHYNLLIPTLNILKPIYENPYQEWIKDDIINDKDTNIICNDKYICKCCNYSTSRKSSYDKHNATLKHFKVAEETKKLHFDTEKLQTVAKKCKEIKLTCELCDKEFAHRSGLWKHKKICLNSNNDQTIKTCQSISQPSNVITTELVMELIKDNKEMKQIILEQHNTINNLVKNGINNINTNTNCMNNNKTFNLQFFLNETCKDAMNITDFVESIKVQLCDLENMGEVGYIEGISNIITSNLKALDVTERPVHCTDKKRETIYIKDDNKWEKEDDNKSHLRKAIKKIASKNQKLLPAYREKYPGCQYAESKHGDKYNKMVIEVLGGEGDNDAEKEDKIIRNISKAAIIKKD